MSWLRSAAAVVAGFGFLNTALWIGGGLIAAVFHALGMGRAAVGAILVVSALAAIMGGWITARISGGAEMAHAAVLAAVMAAITLTVSMGERPEGQPVWYAPVVGVLGVAGILAGGWLRASAASAVRETREPEVRTRTRSNGNPGETQ
jgi:hypothetical protein